jgi:hypothetical protein
MKFLLNSLFLLFAYTCSAAGLPTSTQAEITHLFSYLEKSGCQFNRNGTWYSPTQASEHLNQKYRYLLDKNLIASAEDFINRAAKESSMSGKPYLVQCGDARPVESAEWFKRELATFRRGKP